MLVLVLYELDWVECVVGVVCDWLLGGNSVVWVGILILFFGVVFLFKYVVDNSLLLVEFWLVGVVVGVIVLLGFGWCLCEKCLGYVFVL